MKFDILKEFDLFLHKNESFTAFPVYQHLYNTAYHKSLGKLLEIVMEQRLIQKHRALTI